MQKIVLISRVKNEADVIEAFIRHHIAVVSHIVILDDASDDGTADILKLLQAEGLAITLLHENSLIYDQSRAMSLLLRLAIGELDADWVLPLDADEFLEPISGRSVSDILASSQADVLAVSWTNFLWERPGPEDDPCPILRLQKRTPPRLDQRKVLIHARAFQHASLALSQGNHALLCNGEAVEAISCPELVLGHFPIRSPAQFASKIAVGFLKYAADPGRNPGHGTHYDEPFRLLCKGMHALEAAMRDISVDFSVAPGRQIDRSIMLNPLRYRGGALRYGGRPGDPLGPVLVLAERLAREHAHAGSADRLPLAESGSDAIRLAGDV